MIYLAANTWADVEYAVNQAARFTHRPKHSHTLAIKHILYYLKNTKDMGMFLHPDGNFMLSCYVDYNFGGWFGAGNP